MNSSFDIEFGFDKTDEAIKLAEEAALKALTEIGLQAERNAKKLCAVDTGLLRNSITYAIDGEPPNIGEYKADKAKKGKSEIETGGYSGSVPASEDGERAVYIGTNVEYAQYIEAGSSKKAPKGFLKPAIEEHKSEYMEIIKKNMQNA